MCIKKVAALANDRHNGLRLKFSLSGLKCTFKRFGFGAKVYQKYFAERRRESGRSEFADCRCLNPLKK